MIKQYSDIAIYTTEEREIDCQRFYASVILGFRIPAVYEFNKEAVTYSILDGLRNSRSSIMQHYNSLFFDHEIPYIDVLDSSKITTYTNTTENYPEKQKNIIVVGIPDYSTNTNLYRIKLIASYKKPCDCQWGDRIDIYDESIRKEITIMLLCRLSTMMNLMEYNLLYKVSELEIKHIKE